MNDKVYVKYGPRLKSINQVVGRILLLLFMLFYCHLAFAQEVTVKGTVTSDLDDFPLPGVNIMIKGTSTGTVTDLEGNYAISVAANDTLRFSFIGYHPQEVAVEGRTRVDIALSENQKQLEEVVVIGYGSVRKSDLTGAVSSVEGEDLVKAPAANPIQALQGKVAGLQVSSSSGNPGESPVVRLRGITTLNDNNPIYVVDGVILDDVNFLNSADIASVEVLKDASATAIFGSRGSNGVIIITTKKGTAGQDPIINFRAEYGVENVANQLDLMNGREFAQYVNDINPGTYNNLDVLPNIDWQDLVYKENTPIQSYNLSFMGASERLNYYFGGGYYQQEGVVPKSDYERITIKTNTTYQVKDPLRFGADLSFSLEGKENPPGVVGTAYRAWPINEPYTSGNNFAEVIGGNPLAAIEFSNNFDRRFRLVSNFFGEYDIIEGLTFRSSYQVDALFLKNKAFAPEYFVSPTQQNPTSDLSVNNVEDRRWIWENTLNWNKDFGNQRVDAVVGYTAQERYGERFFGSRQNLLREGEDFWYLDAGETEDQVLSNNGFEESLISVLFRVNYSLLDRYLFTATYRRDGSSKFGRNNRYGNFPSFAVGWNVYNEPFFPDSETLNTLKFRASWGIVGNEKIPGYSQFSTIGSGINAVFGEDEVLQPGATLTQLGNPNLKWEETQQLDIGLEFGFLSNRLTGEVDYYRKETKDILVPLSIPGHVGIGNFQTRRFNAADVLNEGFEFNLDWQDNVGEVTYRVGVLGSTVRNEVLSLGSGSGQDSVIVGGDLGNGQRVSRTVAGRPIGFFYGYKIAGVFQNEEQLNSLPRLSQQGIGDFIYVDTNEDGTISEADRVEIGSWIPDFIYGFSAEAAYKGVKLSLDFQGQSGNSIYNGKQAIRFDLLNYEEKFTERWTGEGTSNTDPRASAGGVNFSPSEYFLEDGSFLRLRTLTLSYDLGQRLLERYKINGAQIYLRGTNLWTSTAYSGYSPEIGVANPISGAIDLGVYPITKVYMLGLNFSF